MPKYKFIVMSKPVEGREAECNDWYQNVHLRDAVACGFKAAQRFRLAETVTDVKPAPYMAIYEAETDDPKALLQERIKRSSTGQMLISGALDLDLYAGMYQELGSRVES